MSKLCGRKNIVSKGREYWIVPVHFVKRFSSDLNICNLCNYLTSIHDKGSKYFVFRGIEGLLNLKQISN